MKELLPSWVRKKYPPGTRIRSRVRFVVDNGVLVDVEPSVGGFVPIRLLGWEPPSDARDVVAKDDVIDTVVTDEEHDNFLLLSNRSATLNPNFDRFQAAFPVGRIVHGPVVNIVEFGIFVRLPFGLDGMVHYTDMAGEPPSELSIEGFHKGQEVEAKVLEVDYAREHVGLTLRHLHTSDGERPWDYFSGRFLVRKFHGYTFAVDDTAMLNVWDVKNFVWRPLGNRQAVWAEEKWSDHRAVMDTLRRSVPLVRLFESATLNGERLAARGALARLAVKIRNILMPPEDAPWPDYELSPEAWIHREATLHCRWHLRGLDPPEYRRATTFELAQPTPVCISVNQQA